METSTRDFWLQKIASYKVQSDERCCHWQNKVKVLSQHLCCGATFAFVFAFWLRSSTSAQLQCPFMRTVCADGLHNDYLFVLLRTERAQICRIAAQHRGHGGEPSITYWLNTRRLRIKLPLQSSIGQDASFPRLSPRLIQGPAPACGSDRLV